MEVERQAAGVPQFDDVESRYLAVGGEDHGPRLAVALHGHRLQAARGVGHVAHVLARSDQVGIGSGHRRMLRPSASARRRRSPLLRGRGRLADDDDQVVSLRRDVVARIRFERHDDPAHLGGALVELRHGDSGDPVNGLSRGA